MLEIILLNAIALGGTQSVIVPQILEVEPNLIEHHQHFDSLYLAKGKPYESDYSREAEGDRRRHELDNLQRDERYYRDGDRYRRTREEYREERERDERRERRQHDDYGDYERDRGSRNAVEELEAERNRLNRLERRLEQLERRMDSRFY